MQVSELRKVKVRWVAGEHTIWFEELGLLLTPVDERWFERRIQRLCHSDEMVLFPTPIRLAGRLEQPRADQPFRHLASRQPWDRNAHVRSYEAPQAPYIHGRAPRVAGDHFWRAKSDGLDELLQVVVFELCCTIA